MAQRLRTTWLVLAILGLGSVSANDLEQMMQFQPVAQSTTFTCEGKVFGGYYADVESGCQMFHVCTLGQKEEIVDIKFLCLMGTVFDQETRVCERVDEVDCSQSEKFYDLNLNLYQSPTGRKVDGGSAAVIQDPLDGILTSESNLDVDYEYDDYDMEDVAPLPAATTTTTTTTTPTSTTTTATTTTTTTMMTTTTTTTSAPTTATSTMPSTTSTTPSPATTDEAVETTTVQFEISNSVSDMSDDDEEVERFLEMQADVQRLPRRRPASRRLFRRDAAAAAAAAAFSCAGRVDGGYYADLAAGCQSFHICARAKKNRMKDYVFQCVRGTLFDQATLTCQEASKVDCDASERLYPELAADAADAERPSPVDQ